LAELFPMQEEPVMDIDASLDSLVLKVAKYLIDDYPANDPRWADHRDLSNFKSLNIFFYFIFIYSDFIIFVLF
jgi:hypothetical protein